MSDHEVGYGKPPVSGRFKPGVSGNPKGRSSRKSDLLPEIVEKALDRSISYQERGQTKTGTFLELSLKMLVEKAASGDPSAAELVLKVREHAERYGESGAVQIVIENWMQDYSGQTGEQKTREAAAARAVESEPHRLGRKP